MIKFLLNYFFFVSGKDDKESIRRKYMEIDHSSYYNVLVIVFILQFVMLIVSLFTKGFYTNSTRIIGYRSSYIALMIICAVAFIVSRYFYKKKKILPYFAVVSVSMVSILIWGASISIFDSLDGKIDLTTFAYTTLALCGIIGLEPWIMSLNVISTSTLMSIIMVALEQTKGDVRFGYFINSISIVLIGIVAATFNFYRRTCAIRLENEIGTLNDALSKKAYSDDLTGLLNRRFLTENINCKLNTGEEASGVMLFDIDYFKNVNDSYGHQTGDICLSALGKIILHFIEDKDAYSVRYGGEEFLIYFSHISREEIAKQAVILKDKVKSTRIRGYNGEFLNIKISIGCSVARDNQTYANLINEADAALYKSKETRDTVTIYQRKK